MLQNFNIMFFQFSVYMMIVVKIFATPSNEAELERRMMGGMGNLMGGAGDMSNLMGGLGGGGGGGGKEKKGKGGGGGGGAADALGGIGSALTGGGGGLTDNSGGGGCKKYKIISARGTGENQIKPTGYAKFISGVLAAVPGGGNYEVRYPATTDYALGPGQGAADANRFFASQSNCPKQLYVLIGYSEGAMVVTQLAAKPTIPAASIAAIIMYGNPYFKGGAPQNSCSAKSGKGIASATGISLPSKFSKVTFDCCLTGDMICQTTGSMVPHLAYGGSASEKAAVAFAVGKLNGAKGGAEPAPGGNPGVEASASGGALGGMLTGGGGGASAISNLMGGAGGKSGGKSGGGMSNLMGGLGGGGGGSGLSALMGGGKKK